MLSARLQSLRRRGFSLTELLLVIALVAVMALLAFQGYGVFMHKGESVLCMKKMRNIGVALAHYVSDNHTWPQEPEGQNGSPPPQDELWDWWYKEMGSKESSTGQNYGVGHDDWFCPAELRLRKEEGKVDEKKEDGEIGFSSGLKDPSYIPMKFGYGDIEPFRHAGTPWLIERAAFHKGEGMNKLLPNLDIQKEFQFEAFRKARAAGGK